MAYEAKDAPTDKLQQFRDWFKLADEAEAEQRMREEEDLDFQIAENQWAPEARQARKGRPMLSVSLLHQPMQLVQNQAAAAYLGIELHPVSETADKELAKIKQGLYARIQRDGYAQQARLWALDRAKQAGRGFYRITTQYDEDSEFPGDQEIVYERILYQELVYVDPAAQRPDFSDARFMFVAAFVPLETFRAEYPQAQYNTLSDFLGAREHMPGWVKGDSSSCAVLVAECFYRVPKGRGMHEIHRAVLTGREILEDAPWMGGGMRYIPIVPVIGRELQPIRGQRRWEGMVRPARDAQQFHNYAVSTLVERLALEPKAPFIVYDDAVEPYREEWDEANSTNRPYLRVKMTTADGKPLPLPQRSQIDGSGMNLAMMAVQQAQDWVQSATAVYSPALGELPARKDAQSGRAIMALQQQTEAGTGNYLENLKQISLPLDARIVLEMMPVVYDRPGRVTQVLGAEDEPRMVMLNAPFVQDPDGRPMPAPQGAPEAETFDLKAGRYSIVPTVGKGPQTRLEQGQEFLAQVMQAVPQAAQFMLDLVFKFRSEPGARELAERFRRHLQATAPHLLGEQDPESPEALKAAAMAAQQQLQQMGQQLQQAMQFIQTEQAKHAAQVEIARLKAEADFAVAQLKAQVDLQKAEMAATVDGGTVQAKAQQVAVETAHDSGEGALDRQHELLMQAREFEHEAGMAAAQQAAQPVEQPEPDGQ